MEPGLASGASAVLDDAIYYIGAVYLGGVSPSGEHSKKVFRYTSGWESFQALPDLFTARSGHCCVCLNGSILVFGGQCESEQVVFASCFELSPAASAWLPLPALPEPRHSASCVAYLNRALLFGGANSSGLVSSLLLFDPGNS
jgi:N-acetylneuraminic acid mutarotase